MLFSFSFCNPSPQFTFEISALDSTIKPICISINDLARNYKSLNGQYIETEGKFYAGFEEFAIYPENSWPDEHPSGFSLALHHGLKMNDNIFKKMQGKKVTVKGRIDITHGPLDYLATIDSIYFWEQ